MSPEQAHREQERWASNTVREFWPHAAAYVQREAQRAAPKIKSQRDLERRVARCRRQVERYLSGCLQYRWRQEQKLAHYVRVALGRIGKALQDTSGDDVERMYADVFEMAEADPDLRGWMRRPDGYTPTRTAPMPVPAALAAAAPAAPDDRLERILSTLESVAIGLSSLPRREITLRRDRDSGRLVGAVVEDA